MALKPEQSAALKDAFSQIAEPITDWLLKDAAERIALAGKMTSTTSYELYRAKALGESQRALKKFLKRQLKLSNKEVRRLFRQAARFSRDNDEERVGLTSGADMEQMTAAAVKLAQRDFHNMTQTLGMVTPGGAVQPLQRFYQETMDFAFEQIFTGAADYQTAIRQATTKMADAGVRTIDYESGRSIDIEAAVRRNMMGGMGLLDEQITRTNHDALGCNGWEISAHANSAPDHEPIQGHQFSDAEWQKMNGTAAKPGTLKRRIGTLNCGHIGMPIILGVNSPQYTEQQLQAFREENAKGITYEGRHYTGYEATQKQRQLESAQRKQKRRILVAETTGDTLKEQAAQIKLQMLRQHYKAFSKAADLPLQEERAWVAGFGRSAAAKATAAANRQKRYGGVPLQAKQGQYFHKVNKERNLPRENFLPKGINVTAVKVDGYRNVYVSDKAAIKPKELHDINKNTEQALKSLGIPKERKPKIVIVSNEELPNAYGKYIAYQDTVYYTAGIDANGGIDEAGGFGAVEYHEMCHLKQAEEYRGRGKIITKENFHTYLQELRNRCKSLLDNIGINEYNVSQISEYARRMYSPMSAQYDEVEAEYRVFLWKGGKLK